MNEAGLTFHHLGLAVKEEEPAIQFLNDLGYKVGEKIFDPLQNVNLRMCSHPAMPSVEMITPAEGKSPIDSIIAKHGACIYHTCYTSNNVAKSLSFLENKGHRILPVSTPKAAILFQGKPVSFYNILGFGIIEIIDMATA
jgi:hypothetical protein